MKKIFRKISNLISNLEKHKSINKLIVTVSVAYALKYGIQISDWFINFNQDSISEIEKVITPKESLKFMVDIPQVPQLLVKH